jgi:hypothetical protein
MLKITKNRFGSKNFICKDRCCVAQTAARDQRDSEIEKCAQAPSGAEVSWVCKAFSVGLGSDRFLGWEIRRAQE